MSALVCTSCSPLSLNLMNPLCCIHVYVYVQEDEISLSVFLDEYQGESETVFSLCAILDPKV